MTTDIGELVLSKSIRDSWQARCLHAVNDDDKFWNVVHAVLWHDYGKAMPVLLQVIYPGFTDITRPFFIGGANVIANGKVVCRMVREGDASIDDADWVVVYDSQEQLNWNFRKLADKLKLSDRDRMELFASVKRWIVADLRIDHLGRMKH